MKRTEHGSAQGAAVDWGQWGVGDRAGQDWDGFGGSQSSGLIDLRALMAEGERQEAPAITVPALAVYPLGEPAAPAPPAAAPPPPPAAPAPTQAPALTAPSWSQAAALVVAAAAFLLAGATALLTAQQEAAPQPQAAQVE